MRTLQGIWGASPPAQSSVTTDMLAASYLDPSKNGRISKDENPLWHEIFQPTVEVVDNYLRRCEGIFKRRVEELIQMGRKPNLYSRSDQFRDPDKELGYKVAALKTYVWKEVCQNNSAERVKELEGMYTMGALDTRLMQAAKTMNKEFKPCHITWVNKPNTEVTVDLQENRSTGAQYDSLQANAMRVNMDLFFFELKQEAAKHLKYLAELDEWDNEFNEDTRRNLEMLHDLRAGAVQKEMRNFYQTTGSSFPCRCAEVGEAPALNPPHPSWCKMPHP